MTLYVPENVSDDVHDAAQRYAAAGWFVGVHDPAGKSPGSVLGSGWPSKTTRDRQVITSWYAARGHLGLFLHVGRSGAWAADVDHPEHLPDVLRDAVAGAPYQATRPGVEPGRGHYLLAVPEGLTFGNGTGRLGGAWGEARGRNGVIVVYPTPHPDGGEYVWERTGPVPSMPLALVEQLDQAGTVEDVATEVEVEQFLATFTASSDPAKLRGVLSKLRAELRKGGSRHDAAVRATTWAMREAVEGLYPAAEAAQAIRELYVEAMGHDRPGGRSASSATAAQSDFHGILSWAIGQAKGVKRPTVEPEPLPDEPGDRVLDDVREWIASHVAFPEQYHAAVVALWAVHTHALDRAASTPRLVLESPEPESGKTRTLECLACVARLARHVVTPSAAVLYRWIESHRPTLLVDEIDAVFGRGSAQSETTEAIRAVINAGHRPGGVIPRARRDGPGTDEYRVYAPVAMAGIAGHLPDTIRSRSIRVQMRRRAPTEKVRDFRERRDVPIGEALGARVAAWVEHHGDEIPEEGVDMPPGVEDRQADVWEPLLAIADAVGGHWPATARAACAAIVADARASDEQSLGVRLLRDLRSIMTEGEDKWPTTELLEQLNGPFVGEDAPWPGFNEGDGIEAKDLARMLKRHGIAPKSIWVGGRSTRGYRRQDFLDEWSRYLPAVP